MFVDHYCRSCGKPLYADAYPATCSNCGEIIWRNPIPVAVLMQPVSDSAGRVGLLLVQRAIQPGWGKLALPGGYLEMTDQSLEAAAVRELYEETGVRIGASDVELRYSSCVDDQVIVFLQSKRTLPWGDILSAFRPNSECSALEVALEPLILAFELHSQALSDFLIRHGGGGEQLQPGMA